MRRLRGVCIFTRITAVAHAAALTFLLGAAFDMLPDLGHLTRKLGTITDKREIFPGPIAKARHGRETGVL